VGETESETKEVTEYINREEEAPTMNRISGLKRRYTGIYSLCYSYRRKIQKTERGSKGKQEELFPSSSFFLHSKHISF
jgi:hypothetical protein